MNTPFALQNLLADIAHEFPAARMEWDPYPSGVRVLCVDLNGRYFELDYTPKRGTGVSENFDDTPPFVGHDAVFDSLEEAIAHFKSLLADAVGVKAPDESAYVLQDKPTSKS